MDMELNARTKICGVMGNPVEHSLSPEIHNAAFQAVGLNIVYLAFPVEDVAGAVQGIRSLGSVRGLSVTIPHKVTVMPYLDEIDATARHIGSVNTIVVRGKHLMGYNTDATGALKALQDGAGSLREKAVVMLGSGGAARAIAFALASIAGIGPVTILGVDDQERGQLVQDLEQRAGLKADEGPLDEQRLGMAIERAQVLVHCTPVGMYPKVGETVIPHQLFHAGLTVMDIVYNPRETRLLKEAAQAGCRVIKGIEMFLAQAVGQFELWTGQPAPVDVMRRVLEGKFA